MTEELNSVQPNPYLFNIEHGRKRKARLAHEIGAGAKCRKCEDKCPGFELHFWRKICQNCRCSKDDHEVEDDDEDIGQFVIGKLFNRPPRTKKDEMEFVHGTDLEMINENTGKAEKIKFDWLPPGVEKSMASRYMERLPVEKRPIAGTDAAKNRKKQLETQFPIYDMDEESRSHNLPQEDLQSFQAYVERIKTQVAGQGLVQEIQAALPEHAQMLQSSSSYAGYGMNAGKQGVPGIPGIPGDDLISDASSDSSGIVPDISITNPWSPVRSVSGGMHDASIDPLHGAKNASGSVLPRSPGLTRAGARTPEPGAQSTGLLSSSPGRSPGKTGYVSPYVSPYKLPTVSSSPSKFGSVPGVSRMSGAASFASGLLGPKPFVPYAAGGSAEAESKGTAGGFSPIGNNYSGISSHGSVPGIASNISGVSGHPGMKPGTEIVEGGAVGDPGVLVGDLGALSDPPGAPGTLPTETVHSGFNPSEGVNLYGQDSFSSPGPVPGDIYRTRNVVYDSRMTDQSSTGVPYAGTGLPQGTRVMPGVPGTVPGGQSIISGSHTGPGMISGSQGSVLGRPGAMSGSSGGRGSDAEYTGGIGGVPSKTHGGLRSQLPGSAGAPGSEHIYGNLPGAGNMPDISSGMTAMNLSGSQSGALATQVPPCQPGLQHTGGVLPLMSPQGGRRVGDVKMVDAVQAPYGASVETLASSSSLAPGSNVSVQLPGESRILSRSPDKAHTPHNSKFSCQYCEQVLKTGDVAVFAERAGGDKCWHPECFVCVTCKELLADLIYFYQDGKVYCGRHFTDAANMARCKACDELIFGNSWTRADGFDWHLDHFCCYMCDTPLAGQRYVPDQQGQSYCLPCYMSYKSKTCEACEEKISPEMNRCGHRGYFYHATPQCFKCYTCKDDLLGKRFKMSKNWVFCSQECIQSASDAIARNPNPKERLG